MAMLRQLPTRKRRSAFHLCLPRSFFSGADPPGSCSNSLCATLLGRTLSPGTVSICGGCSCQRLPFLSRPCYCPFSPAPIHFWHRSRRPYQRLVPQGLALYLAGSRLESQSLQSKNAPPSSENRAHRSRPCAQIRLSRRSRKNREFAKSTSRQKRDPKQQEALTACQKVRAANRPPAAPGVHHGGTHTGPCGELLPATHPATPAGNPTREKFPAEQQTVPQ